MAQIKIVKPVSKQMAKRKGGRKPAALTLTDEQLNDAKSALAVGFPQSRVAALLGISEAAFSRMIRKDTELANTLSVAKETGKKELLDIIKGHAQKHWMAASWILDRCYPQEFAQQTRTSSGSAVTINLQNILQAQAKRPAESGNKSVDV